MKLNLGQIANEYTPAALLERLRLLIKDLEAAFLKIRIDDQIIIGGGTPILEHLSANRAAVAAANYSANPIAANTVATFTITVTGAATGDVVCITPNGSPGTGLVWSGYVSAADTVTANVGNVTTGAVTPTTRDWRADVWQH